MLKKSKRVLALVISVIVLAGCGAKPAAPAADPAPAKVEEKKEEAAAPAVEEKKEEAAPAAEAEAAPADVTEYSFLMAWNGGAASFPEGFLESEVMKKVIAKTGVSLKVETITSSEREKLAMVFASGDVPDMTNAPHWGTDPGGEGELIKNAAVEGLLYPLAKEIDKYPNIKRLYDIGAISQLYMDRDIKHPDYNGEIYVIPTQTGRTKDDTFNWAYNVFAREDILKKLNVTPESITSSEQLYDLLKKIKDGGFVDTNGKPVIPAGAWHNGWDYTQYMRSWWDGGATNDWVLQDGQLVRKEFTQSEIDRFVYMRKLFSEGLFDPECLTQSDTMAREKMSTGRVATFSCHYPNQYGFFMSTLYKTNPEMNFVPLGPILNARGEVPTSVSKIGRTGSPVIILNKNIATPEKALGMIDYLNSDEGLLLTKYGIEGDTYTMVDGVPTYTEAAMEIKSKDYEKWNLMGFGFGGSFIGADPSISRGWDPDYVKEGYVKARAINPISFVEYTTVPDLFDFWEGKADYNEKLSTTNYGDELKKACLAGSDEEVVAIVEAQRKRMIDAGYEDLQKFVQSKYEADPKILE